MKLVLTGAVGVVVIVLIIWTGLRISPAPFSSYEDESSRMATTDLPEGLPRPVERFYQELYGDQVPVVESAVISGRGALRIGGIRFSARFRFIHDAGSGYRHYIETTFFQWPLMRVNEYYLDGRSRMDLPFGVTEDEPKVNQGANLALWAETLAWLPGLLVADERVQWEAADDEHTAVLVVPYEGREERLTVQFDPETGLFDRAESMRYREADSPEKTLWINEVDEWASLGGWPIPTVVRLTWGDEDSPWAIFSVDELVYNADVADQIRAQGP